MKLESNIWKLYVIKALRSFMVIVPIIVLFFQDNGLSLKEVLILQSLFSLSIVFLEVPSGYFADVVGRKVSIVLGTIFGFLGFTVYSFSYGFWGFLVAELVLSIGLSLISGADSAFLYDTLLQLKKPKEYKKAEGRLMSVSLFSVGLASIIGGFIALISLRTPLYVEAGLAFLTIPFALALVEPKRHKLVDAGGNFKRIMKIVKYSLHEHFEVKWLIIYGSLLSASTLTLFWFMQPYFRLVALPLAYFGIVMAIFQFSAAIFALYADKYESLMGRKNSLISLIFFVFLGYLLIGIFDSIWAIVFMMFFYFVRGMTVPIFKDYINKLISSDIRATVMSVQSLVGRLIFSIAGPFIGWAADLYSLQIAFLISGSTFLLFSLVSLGFLSKHKAL